jgi:hypothetical protein
MTLLSRASTHAAQRYLNCSQAKGEFETPHRLANGHSGCARSEYSSLCGSNFAILEHEKKQALDQNASGLSVALL